MLHILLPILFPFYVLAQQRWYYTGKFKNDDVTAVDFSGTAFTQQQLYDHSQPKLLYYGGIVSSPTYLNETFHQDLISLIKTELLGFDNATSMHIDDSVSYMMHLCRNYGLYSTEITETLEENDTVLNSLKFMGEVGLYDHQRRVFLEKYWRDITIGELRVVKFYASNQHTMDAATSIDQSNEGIITEVMPIEVDVTASGEAVVPVELTPSEVNISIAEVTEFPDFEHDATVSDSGVIEDVASAAAVVAPIGELHQISYTTDMMGRSTVYSHTWAQQPSFATAVEEENVSPVNESAAKAVRVMSYNLWHNNPPSWVYHNHRERWDRYTKRLSHFADIVVAENPDILALQEVRLDGSFVSPTGKVKHWFHNNMTKYDGGNQAEHILSHLTQARNRLKRKNSLREDRDLGNEEDMFGYYQFIFQPAMSMVENQKLSYRNEEGVMMLSRFPILDYQVLLLPRTMTDPSDDHQRTVLNVKIQIPSTHIHTATAAPDSETDSVPGSGVRTVQREITVDVMTSHFSLNEAARNRGVRHLMQQVSGQTPLTGSNSKSYPPSPIQILAGDFNAEPEETAIKYLLGRHTTTTTTTTAAAADSSVTSESSTTSEVVLEEDLPPGGAFIDAWEYVQSQHHHQQQQEKSILEGHTFPACSPIKRIDYLFIRNLTQSTNNNTGVQSATGIPGIHANIIDFRVVGKRPTADTEYLVGSREGLGMNDKDSPVWGSDHYAVVTDINIIYTP